MNKVTYREIEKIELKRQLFDGFERYQDCLLYTSIGV